jgi:XTP/dITP diphosphohydrolase
MTDAATLAALQKLIDVVAKLRSPDGGCPWDLAQTPESLTRYIIEEAYETVDAIRQGEPDAIADELGDLLLQVVLQAQIASEYGQFDLTDIANAITEKLIRRHPHVFGDVAVENVDDVHRNWEQIKAAEEQDKTGMPNTLSPRLDRYARSLPPIMASMKISKKVAAVGFDWDTVDGVWDKFHEEMEEFREAIATDDEAHQQAELGDLFFTLVSIARWYNLDPSQALAEMNHRFVKRFSLLEAYADRPLADYTIDEFEQLWQQIKAQLKAQATTQPPSL